MILDRRTIYDGNKSIKQVLIQWDSSILEAWENLFDLEEKVLLENNSDDTNQYLTKAKDDRDSGLGSEIYT